jgi:phage terminase Nu1 subunit (DNA packaging protein)
MSGDDHRPVFGHGGRVQSKSGMSESIVKGIAAVAAHFNKSERQVRRWRRQGMPGLSGGRFDLIQVQGWLDERDGRPPVRGQCQPDPRQPDLTEQRGKIFQDERLKRFKADLAEMELRQRRGELVERAEVEQLFISRIMVVKQGLLSLPRGLPPQLAACREEREMEAVIARAVRQLLEAFSRPLPEALGGTATPAGPEVAEGGACG